MLNMSGRMQKTCEGFTRRQLLQAGGAGLLGVNLPKVLAAESTQPSLTARAKSVIFLFLFGGPSQLETFDLKPEAPGTIRGPHLPIHCRTPGLLIGEHLPKLANISDKYCVLKTMTHDFNDHSGGGHYVQTGHRWHIPVGGGFNATPQDWPSMGSVTDYVMKQQARVETVEAGLPNYAVVPNYLGRLQETLNLYRPGEYAGWLGRTYEPLTTAIDKRDPKDNPYWRNNTDDELTFQIQGLVPSKEISLNRLHSRIGLLEQFDQQRRQLDQHEDIYYYNRFQQTAFDLVSSEKTRKALDIRQESDKLRDEYGRHLFGQSTLMARRLVEAGVRFVTVHYDCVDGYSWDSHRSSHHLEKHLLPTFDQALSALLVDLEERGILDETLVVAMGEMGRTPKSANKVFGRNHWSTLFPAVLAGAGIPAGTVIGETDKDAAYPLTHATSPEDLAATVYSLLGIDPELRVRNAEGRPTHIVDGGTPVKELLG